MMTKLLSQQKIDQYLEKYKMILGFIDEFEL